MLAEQPRFNPASQELGELYISQGRWSDLEELAGSLSATNAAEASRLLACMSRARQELSRRIVSQRCDDRSET